MTIYILQRKNKNGFLETIQAHMPCKGWRVIQIIKKSN